MSRKSVYLLLCVLGVVLPYSQFVPWVIENGLHIGLLFRQLFASRAGGFFGMDVLVSSVVLVVFMRMERRRLAIRFPWMPIVGLCAVGVSLGLPLFLYFRESALEVAEETASTASAAKL
jgi:hypothetical protein